MFYATPVLPMRVNIFIGWSLNTPCKRIRTTFDLGRSLIGSGNDVFKSKWAPEKKPLAYWFWLAPEQELPSLNQKNPKIQFAIAAWKLMPAFIIRPLGPYIIRGLVRSIFMPHTLHSLKTIPASLAPRIAEIHLGDAGLLSKLGYPFVLRYFEGAIKDDRAFGFYAQDDGTGEIMGFSLASPEPSALTSKLTEDKGWFIQNIIKVIFHPPGGFPTNGNLQHYHSRANV